MRLSEIQDSEFFTTDSEAQDKVTSRYNSDGEFSEIGNIGKYYVESLKIAGGAIYWFLVIEGEPIGMIMLKPQNIANRTTYCVSWLWLNKIHRGRDLIKQLYIMIADTYGEVASDYDQTPGSEKVWKSLFGSKHMYGLGFVDGEGQRWLPIDDRAELDKTWSEDKYHRLLLSKDKLH